MLPRDWRRPHISHFQYFLKNTQCLWKGVTFRVRLEQVLMRFHEFYRGDWWRNSTRNGVSKSARGGRAGSGQKRPHFAHFENFLKKIVNMKGMI